METCVRGLSYIPESKVEDKGMQYIESGELERTWKTTRRQRLKQQEQKIWDEFVKEKDVLYTLCKDDPYQFLDRLPESCLKELMDTELQRMKKEQAEEEGLVQPEESPGDTARAEEVLHTVTFADDGEKEETEMFHIFDSEKDEDLSGVEDEIHNDSLCSPCTVRENERDDMSPSLSHNSHRQPVNDKESNKSSENVTAVIESSIYCAKVKELRIKIDEEMRDIIKWLQCQQSVMLEAEEAGRVCRRAAQFSARFGRIHLYQLQRQLHDMERHSGHPAPFAQHTHFQSLMVRIVSLHHNLLQSYQVFRKSFEQTLCVRESVDTGHSLTRATRVAATLCGAGVAPSHFATAALLYDDNMVSLCDELDAAADLHSQKMDLLLQNTKSRDSSMKKIGKYKGKKRSIGASAKSNSKSHSEAEGRLSMYSLDTLRINLNPKSCSSKDNQSSGTSKKRGAISGSRPEQKNESTPKSNRKSPRWCGPLMRAGGARRPRPPLPPPPRHDHDVRTMVEAVGTCTSSHMSREPSPRRSPGDSREVTPRTRSDDVTPRTVKSKDTTPRKSQTTTPRSKIRAQSPKAKVRRSSPTTKETIKAVLSTARSQHCGRPPLTPASNIKYDKKPFKTGQDETVKLVVDSTINSMDSGTFDVESGKTDADTAKSLVDSGKFAVDSGKSLMDSGKYVEDSSKFDGNTKNSNGNKVGIDTTKYNRESAESHEIGESSRDTLRLQPEDVKFGKKMDRDRTKGSNMAPARCEVTRLLRQLCSGDGAGSRSERVTGAKNAQLVCINGGSPRHPSTPQLLRILEETIQKKEPKLLYQKSPPVKDLERYRLTFNIPDKTADGMFQYRTKFVQHMLTSPMYANSAVGKPWEMIGSVSDKIIDEVILGCAKEMQLQNVIHDMYKSETK